MEANVTCWRWSGLFPYYKANGFYKISIWHIAICPIAAIAAVSTNLNYHLSTDFSFWGVLPYSMMVVAKSIAATLPVYTSYLLCFYHDKILGFVENLEEIDIMLSRNGFENSKKRTYKWRYFFHIGYFAVSYAYDQILKKRNIIITLSYVIYRLVWVICVVYLIDFIHLFQSYFTLLNRLTTCQLKQKQLECLAICHNKLYVLLCRFDNIFSFSTLLVICHIALNIANFMSFYIFFYEIYGLAVLKIELVQLLPLMSLVIVLFQLVYNCEEMVKSANEFNTLLYQLMLDDKTKTISENKKLQLHIAMKRDVVFTAYGFFTIDYTLLHSMLAAATTYMVILIQFGKPNVTPTTEAPAQTSGNTTDVLY